MRVIKKVIDYMHNTLDEANDYYDTYLDEKTTNPKVARKALEMAKTHMELYMQWHQVVESLIADYRAKSGDIPVYMQEMYDILHKDLEKEYKLLKLELSEDN